MRIDTYLVNKNLYKSRNKASEGIARGEVLLNGKICTKPSTEVKETDEVSLKQKEIPFVSLGGYKLQIAIKTFNPQIKDNVFIDIGASTGGFTDCLLRYGAKKVYCVDVGENLLDPQITSNERVVVMDKTNARYLTPKDFNELANAIVIDCSFISLEYILPPISTLIKQDGYIMALIKPQFELQEKKKLKNGVLKSSAERDKILKRLYDFSIECGLTPLGLTCVTTDKSKNLEYIFWLSNGNIKAKPFEKILV